MELKTDALVLRCADWRENDRIVTLLTAERGKIAATMRGVKKAGAKLNFASQPFCFAEYVLAEKGGRFTVTGASLYDGFFALREDITALYGAACVLQAADVLVYEGMDGEEFLISAVRALGKLSSGEGPSALVWYLLKTLSLAGYPVAADRCPVCGNIPSGRMRFDMDRGIFTCTDHSDGPPASGSSFLAIRAALAGEPHDDLDGNMRALRILGTYFSLKTDAELKSIGEYLRLLHPMH